MENNPHPPRQTATTFFQSDMRLGEGPIWSPQDQALFVVDILDGRFYYLPTSLKRATYYDFDRMISVVLPIEQGGLLVAQEDRIIRFFPEEGDIEEITPFEADLLNNRSNDGKCDSLGRFYIGTMHKQEEEEMGSLYLLNESLEVEKLTGKRTISNGLAWSPDGRTLYYIDSPTRRVVAFDVDFSSGHLSNERVCFPILPERGFPDGMTIDTEGMLWIAHYGGACVARYHPDTGQTLYLVEVPAPHVTSCTFGGPDLDILYITTARKDLTPEEADRFPLAGSVFQATPGFKGLPVDPFRF